MLLMVLIGKGQAGNTTLLNAAMDTKEAPATSHRPGLTYLD